MFGLTFIPYQALRCQINLSLGLPPTHEWISPPGYPCNKCMLDQIRSDNNVSPADLWRRAINRGHSGVTLRSTPTTR